MNRLSSILAITLLATASAVHAQPGPRPVQTNRIDRNGVEWLYGERNDAMDDRREIGAVARFRRSVIGLFCLADSGAQMRVKVPGWFFMPGTDSRLQVRIDRQDAVDVTVTGGASDGSYATIRSDRTGRDLVRAFAIARERIAVRNVHGETITIPLASPRPEVDRFMRRCQEIAPTLPEAD